MKLFVAAVALTAYSASALSIPRDAQASLRTIELSPGNTKQVTEEQKFELLAVSFSFQYNSSYKQ